MPLGLPLSGVTPDLSTSPTSALQGLVSNILPSATGPNTTNPSNFELLANDGRTQAAGLSSFFINNYGLSGQDWGRIYGYKFAIYGVGSKNLNLPWVFPMPLSPQNISVDVPAATALSVMMKGYREEHNGAPLRRITIRGTSGVYPNTGDFVTAGSTTTGLLDYMFKNTIQQVNRVVNTATQVANTFSALFGNPAQGTLPLNYDTSSPAIGQSAGYIWTHALIRFLDSYLEMKKNKENKGVRFQFLMYKDKMYWDCTLNSYSIRKAPGSLEYEYEINLTAWRRSQNPVANRSAKQVSNTSQQTLNKLAEAMNLLQESRLLISQSVGVLAGIRSDINQSFLTPMREVILLGEEIVGAAETILDFPNSLIQGCKAAILSLVSNWSTSATNPAGVAAVNNALAQSGINPTTSVKSLTALPPGQTIQQTVLEQQSLGTADNTPLPETSSPIEQVFQQPQANAGFFTLFPVDQLQLTPNQTAAIQQERNRVQNFTVQDLITRRNLIRGFAYSISLALGGGAKTYSNIFNLPQPPANAPALDVDSIILLSQINDVVQSIDSLINYYNNLPFVPTNDYFNYYAALAQANSITFASSTSKFFVPMLANSSLEALAAQYLGDSDRWVEIAALNGLQDPYIDETGFNVPLITNGSGSTVSVASAENLFVGQAVQIQANGLQPVFTVIATIEIVSSVESVITLNYGTNVNGYTVALGASLFAYLPNTINYLSMVAIPSDLPVNVPGNIQLSPAPEDLTYLTYLAKADFLLTNTGDLAMTSGGDILVASGVQNLTQAATMKVQTAVRSIVSNPTYGNPAQPGMSIADMSATDIVQSLSGVFQTDPRFSGILAAKASVQGPAVTIDFLVSVANSEVNLPIQTQVPV